MPRETQQTETESYWHFFNISRSKLSQILDLGSTQGTWLISASASELKVGDLLETICSFANPSQYVKFALQKRKGGREGRAGRKGVQWCCSSHKQHSYSFFFFFFNSWHSLSRTQDKKDQIHRLQKDGLTYWNPVHQKQMATKSPLGPWITDSEPHGQSEEQSPSHSGKCTLRIGSRSLPQSY